MSELSIDSCNTLGSTNGVMMIPKCYNRRSRYSYSSQDLLVFRYSFKIDHYLLGYLKFLGLLRAKIKRRGCSAGKRKKRFENKIDKHIGRFKSTNDHNVRKKSFKIDSFGVNSNNLIYIDRRVIKYSYPKFIFANCRSIRNKFDEISALMSIKNPDVAVFVETWLSQCDIDAYEIKGFRAIHLIRERIDKAHGGGVSLFVNKDVSIMSIGQPEDKNIEILTVLLRTKYMQRSIPFIAVIAVYSPPANIHSEASISYIISEIDRIKSINADADIMVLGDFNDLDIDKKLKKPFFSQIIKQQTCNLNLIDKCYYNGKVKYVVETAAPISTSDHKMVEITPINYVEKYDNNIYFQSRPRRNSCYRDMGRKLTNVQWESFLAVDDCDTATENFHSLIVKYYEECFPIVFSKKKKKTKSWFCKQVQNEIISHNSLFKNNEMDQYHVMNKKVKDLISIAKKKRI